jgi:multiple sugar transport system permease protein
VRPSPWAAALTHALALLAVAYLVLPFLWLVGASLSTEREFTRGRVFPTRPSTQAYAAYAPLPPPAAPPRTGAARDTALALGLETARGFVPAMGNSLLIAACVALINLCFGALAAYGLARVHTRANLALLVFYLVSRSIPAVALMIPMYLLIKNAGLLDNPLAVILAHSTFTLPFTVWLLKGYFHTVPVDLERAARVDGCSRLKALLRVFLPVTAPGLVAAGIFSFISSWGEFLYALLFTTRYARPVTVLVSDFVAELDIPFPLIAAGGVIAVLLPVLLAFLFQRFIVRGIGGAVTG